MVLEIQSWSVNYNFVARICKNNPKWLRQKQYTAGFKVNKRFWITFHTAKNYFQQYYQSYCNYLSKIGHMDKERAVFEQITLRDFKKWSFTALNAHSQVWTGTWKPFQNAEKMLFTSNTLLVLMIQYLNFCLELLVMSTASLER